MDIQAVYNEVGEALESIEGLTVLPFAAKHVSPPTALFGFPEDTVFNETYKAGADSFTIPLSVVVANLSDALSTADLFEYGNGSGPKSIRALINNHSFTTCSTAVCRSAEFGTMTINGVTYLSVTFDVNVFG